MCDIGKNYKAIGSIEALELTRRVSGNNATLVHYYLHPYSDDLLGTLGTHLKLVLETKSADSNDTNIRTFFVKSVPYDDPTEAAYVKQKRVFEQETTFFGSIVADLTKNVDIASWAPNCYLIKDDVLVFEDLGAKGYSIRGPILEEPLVKSAIKTIARFHASSILAEARLDKSFYEIYPNLFREMIFMGFGKTHSWCTAGVDAAVVVADNLGLDSSKFHSLYEKALEIAKQEKNAPSKNGTRTKVVSHGDLWVNNMMFDDNEQANCLLVDFQCGRYTSPAQDLMLLLYFCTTRDFRKRRERDMIRFYHKILRETVAKNNAHVNVLSLDEMMKEIEEQRLRAVVSAAIYSSSVYISRRFAVEVIDDPIKYQKYQYHDRRDVVLKFMKNDELFKSRVEESVQDFAEFAGRF